MGKKERNGKENHTTRIGKLFFDDLNLVQKVRIQKGLDKRKVSMKKLTNLITKHDNWPAIREDLLNVKIKGDEL